MSIIDRVRIMWSMSKVLHRITGAPISSCVLAVVEWQVVHPESKLKVRGPNGWMEITMTEGAP